MLKQIYEDARAKMIAERDSATATAVATTTTSVIQPKLAELEQAKMAAINEKTSTYNTSLATLKEQYDASISAIRVQYEKDVEELRVACETAKTTFQESQLALVRAEVSSKYSTEIAKLEDLIAKVGDSF